MWMHGYSETKGYKSIVLVPTVTSLPLLTLSSIHAPVLKLSPPGLPGMQPTQLSSCWWNSLSCLNKRFLVFILHWAPQIMKPVLSVLLGLWHLAPGSPPTWTSQSPARISPFIHFRPRVGTVLPSLWFWLPVLGHHTLFWATIPASCHVLMMILSSAPPLRLLN